MRTFRQALIQICDNFIQDQIGRQEVKDFTRGLLGTHQSECDDAVIAQTLLEWDNEAPNLPINKVNMRFWKDRLLSPKEHLIGDRIWNAHMDMQKSVCEKYGSQWNLPSRNLRVGVSDNLDSDPIHGLRHPAEKGTTGWFIWTGTYSESTNFFQPMCVERLINIRPQILRYLGLDIGFRFLADNNGYEDVWYDETLVQLD
jgi:hypothetical protein